MSKVHQSVLMKEVIESFSSCSLRIFIDGTAGAGGHSAALLAAHPEIERLIAIDQDPLALTVAAENLAPWSEKVTFVSGNFENLEKFLDQLEISTVDGILLDLGVSSMQLDIAEKGFSFSKEGPLDMRMDPRNPLTAAIVVNTWPQKELERIFRDYGEERHWRAAARAIVQARAEKQILTTQQLVEVLRPVLRFNPAKRIHPCTLVFQALRICVNKELDVVERVIPAAIRRLKKGGRLGIISFHSLEDGIVKNLFRHAASDKWDTRGLAGLFRDKDPEVRLLTRKPLVANDEEVAANPRSRSAKLRVLEKL
ncbi:ribosomal RNA smaLL subunit methyltransferase H [Parachlamydia acanthamoebae UV-7]|uniref:Ribosomal RNA small subunit methyltransferase H n=1 Tax=Parachlamydia acanthamoebae (strain UV7) TaxID=765952 RepID=F8KXF8_PARAV|nr:16S rRNA (cytosine(1402)-N(4))-methyltransferase RsmH [Parachlamydia acanthamoebae]CCB86913.1 ribosomal RNA smaLL subunit methyltransferase H [Parachlamydia acanthamoebae UV-7]